MLSVDMGKRITIVSRPQHQITAKRLLTGRPKLQVSRSEHIGAPERLLGDDLSRSFGSAHAHPMSLQSEGEYRTELYLLWKVSCLRCGWDLADGSADGMIHIWSLDGRGESTGHSFWHSC